MTRSPQRRPLPLSHTIQDKDLLPQLVEAWMQYVTRGERHNAISSMSDYEEIADFEDLPLHVEELIKQTEILRGREEVEECEEKRLHMIYRPLRTERVFLERYRVELQLPDEYDLEKSLRARRGALAMLSLAKVNLAEQLCVEVQERTEVSEFYKAQRAGFVRIAMEHVENSERLLGFFSGLEKFLLSVSEVSDHRASCHFVEDSIGLEDMIDFGGDW